MLDLHSYFSMVSQLAPALRTWWLSISDSGYCLGGNTKNEQKLCKDDGRANGVSGKDDRKEKEVIKCR